MAYEQLAFITDGAFAGSTELEVTAVQANGTNVRVYDAFFGDTGGFNELGNEAVTGNVAIVNTNRPLVEGEPLWACVEEFGEKVGGVILVRANAARPTGWKKPDTVLVGEDTLTAAEYEEQTGIQLPAVYDPEPSNHTPNIPASGIEKLTGIGFDLIEKVNEGSVILTVSNVKNCSQGYSVKFDTDAASNIHSKTYNLTGSKTIRVIDANDPNRYYERIYSVDVPVAPVPVSKISNASYSFNWAGALLGIEVFADGDAALEMKIDGVTVGPWLDMNLVGAKRYQRGYGVPQGPGTYLVTVRVKSNINDYKTFNAVLS